MNQRSFLANCPKWPLHGALFCVLLLAGCTAQPLYNADRAPSGAVGKSQFAGRADFKAPDTRFEQLVRNEMIFQLNGGGASAATNPVYLVDLDIKSVTRGRFRTPNTSIDQTSAALVTMTGTMSLSEPATGELIKSVTSSAIAALDRTGQQFADERAEMDAQRRAATELGRKLSTLLAIELRKAR